MSCDGSDPSFCGIQGGAGSHDGMQMCTASYDRTCSCYAPIWAGTSGTRVDKGEVQCDCGNSIDGAAGSRFTETW